MADYAKIKAAKERAEQEYDALVTKLNRCQGQLGSKQVQAQKLSPPEYVEWFAAKKREHAEIVDHLHKKKAVRAEARRAFNGWQPQVREEWIEWPDEEGWWWNYADGEMTMHHFVFMDGEYIFSNTDKEAENKAQLGSPWSDCWKFQEEPEWP